MKLDEMRPRRRITTEAIEQARLNALRALEVLDSSPELEFTDLVVEAARSVGGGVGIISLVDADRIWIKAHSGLKVSTMPRAGAFCDVTIRSDGPLVVCDSAVDPRFASPQEEAERPAIRAYLGQPLVLSCGARIGALSVIDQAPRQWTEDDVAAIGRFARVAARLLEARRDEREYRRALETVAELNLQNDQAETAFAAMGEGVILQDRDSIILHYNASAARLLGLSEDALLGRSSMDPRWSLVDEDSAPLGVDQQPSMVCLRTGEPVLGFVLGVNLPEGGRRWLSINSLPVFREGEETPFRTVTTFADITETRRQARALQAALEEARRANQAKSDFLANVSHELRTPLNGIISMAGAIARTPLDARQREMIDLIVSSGTSLEQIVSDLLDISKIEAGEVQVEAAPFHLGEVVRAVTGLFGSRAADKGLEYSVDVPAAAERMLLGDSLKIRQIVSNLVSNAVKFTTRGTVRIEVSVEESATAGVFDLAIAVRDSGVGIAPEHQAAVFDRFQQADLSTTRRFGGTGLGLAISRALAERMGGTITLASAPGYGSTFTLCLSLPGVEMETAGPKETVGGEGLAQLRILLAEDHPVNQRVVSLLLEPLGVELTIVENGALAVKAAEAGAFDLILMDMQMPEMDGLTAIKEIRRQEAARRLAPSRIVMMTANPSESLQQATRAAGADAYLAKPVTPDAFYACLESALEPAVAAP
ncbi:MAG: ATP-binding protein [Pseudomonadota bacterium]